jgi:hypothetical protein
MSVFRAASLFFYIPSPALHALLGWMFTRGMGLAQMIPLWFAGLLMLYPLCAGSGRFKQSRRNDS